MENQGSKKIRTGDQVKVCAGNARGMKGEVIACWKDKVVVRGLNLCRKHVKKSKDHPQGGLVEHERPIHISNVRPCDSSGNILKLRIEDREGSGKSLCYTKDGESVVWRSMKRKQM